MKQVDILAMTDNSHTNYSKVDDIGLYKGSPYALF